MDALLDSSSHAGFPITVLDLRNQKCVSSNENTGTKIVIFSKLPCLRLTAVDFKVRKIKYSVSYAKGFRGEICAMYNHTMLFHESRFVEIHSFLLLFLSGSGDLMFFEKVCLTLVLCTGFQTNVA